MSTSRHLTEKEIRSNFKLALRDITKNGKVPTDQGFDDDTFNSLLMVANSFPDIDSNLVEKAKEELDRQFDGTHSAWQATGLTAALAEARERR